MNHHNDLIRLALPAPYSLVMGVVGLYEWVVAHPDSPKVPFILGGFTCASADAIILGD